ncbi:hypothetical protein U750_05500 [Streptococcus pseudopneumoniae G42]|nr:hypothetical protein HMPREF1046_0897 [Streptococcus pseudopneumoniae ATCC BAA-960 = CCUG 49455]ETD92236.1 hypothetical protein U752_09440 [Streptococcus pseudopneumoniae 1321]ETE07275.1 hypothetical protein U751_00420 [Streptococcus pseudopneumoniae 22725]ETE07468.1 hypothetical protein U750_05500 [Streptococcus pseudopneumoniae G42]
MIIFNFLLTFKNKVISFRYQIMGMVETTLERLNEGELVEIDEERKAAMVSNLLVVLCGNHDAQPIVNTGSLY